VYLHGGPERVISEVVARSRHSWTVFTNRYEPDATFPVLKQHNVVQLPLVSVRRTFLHAAAAAWRIARQRLPLDGYDALLVFCEGLGDLALIRSAAIPTACLCLTPLRPAFDAHYQDGYLRMKGGGIWRRLLLRAAAAGFRAVDRRLWNRYRRVFAISGEVRRRIVAGRLYPAERVELLYPGVDLERLRPTGDYSGGFVIPGRIMWTKNLELAIEAFRLLLRRRPDLGHLSLTLAGYVDRKSGPYLAKLQAMAAGCEQIRFVVSPSDEELFGLTGSAYAVLYPPFNEDWGLVPLEAMALEKPIVAVNRGGPSESVLHGESGLLVEAAPEPFAAAMEKLADDPALVRRLGRRARLRAAEFDWSRFCTKLDGCLEEMARPGVARTELASVNR
jgi:glycosyltransferase involved in cell wall biosynthesis